MIITKLEGGLGNQMFQFAVGYILAKKNQSKLLLDQSTFLYLASDARVTKYKYALGVFPCIKDKPATIFDLGLLSPIMIPHVASLWERIYSQLHLGNKRVFHEKQGFTYDKEVFELNGNVFLWGFWQHAKYLEKYRKELLKVFIFSDRIQSTALDLIGHIPLENRVSVHVRRGDYSAIGLGMCSIQYYKKAYAQMKKHVKNPTFIVVSNDIDWAKKELAFIKPAIWIKPEAGHEAIDLCILSKCAHHIIANSTFSWWGAWLNPNPRKIVVAPDPWFDWEAFKGKTPALTDWILLAK